MITLITGRPGHGKSLYTVNQMMQEQEKGRHIIAINFNGLQLEVEERDDLEKWQNYPQGSLIVVDEMQAYAKTRQKGDAQAWITAFSTHRHLGLDFIFVTQHPALLDVWVRRLVETHIHLVRSPTKGEFASLYRAERVIDVSDKRDTEAIDVEKSTFNYPKEVYNLYHSADEHTVKKRIPKKLIYGLVGALLIFTVIGYAIFKISDLLTTETEPEISQEQRTSEKVNEAFNEYTPDYQIGRNARIPRIEWQEPEQYIAEENMPWSAPIYSEQVKVRAVPRITACVNTPEFCNCYTQQGTKAHVSKNFCKSFIKDGMFDFQLKEPIKRTTPIQSNKSQKDIREARI